MEPALLIVLAIGVAIAIRLIAGGFDGERVEAYVREQGWELLDKSWAPFGPGWFGEKDSRIYEIVYRDTRGDTHRAHVKTSMMSGVYLTKDRIVERAEGASRELPAPSEAESLRLENERLRARVRELEQRD